MSRGFNYQSPDDEESLGGFEILCLTPPRGRRILLFGDDMAWPTLRGASAAITAVAYSRQGRARNAIRRLR